jgi:hypothetical protein
MAREPTTPGGGFEMPHELTARRRSLVAPKRDPLLPGTRQPRSRKGPRECPALESISLQWVCSSPGTLGPYFRGKEGQRVKGWALPTGAPNTHGNVPARSLRPHPDLNTQVPLRCSQFQLRDMSGTLLEPCLNDRGRHLALRLPPPLVESSPLGRRTQPDAFFIGAAAAGPCSIASLGAE